MNRQRQGGWNYGEGRCDETLAQQCAGWGVCAAEVLRVVVHAGRRPEEAEIVMQRAWLKFLERQPEFAGEDAAEQRHRWFLTTIHNTAVDMARYARRHPAQSLDALPSEPQDRHDEQSVEQAEKEARYRRLDRLMERLRAEAPINWKLLVERRLRRRKLEELVAETGLAKNQVSCRIRWAIQKLHAWASELEDDETALE